MYPEMFPAEILALQEEIQNHPALMAQLAQAGHQEIEDRMGLVCAFCGIGLDGYYDNKDILHLADVCTKKLRETTQELILDYAPGKVKH